MAQPFYLQVVQSICEQIVADKAAEGDLLPSIRKLSLKYQLNPNTVQRSMAYLVQLEILESARGTGFFVREGAKDKIFERMRREFWERDAPEFCRKIRLLKIDSSEFARFERDYSEN